MQEQIIPSATAQQRELEPHYMMLLPEALIYNSTTSAQTATTVEFPATGGPANLTVNNTAASPNNILNVPFNRTLGTTGVLSLTSGILNNTGFAITIPNTITGSIVGGSSTSFIRGAVIRTLPASLAATTYNFPVGKAGYNPLDLVNATTNSGGTVSIRVETFDAGSGGTAGTLMESISTTRYWSASIINGAANFTGTQIKLTDTRGAQDGIAASTTLTGTYDHIGGTSSTLTATSITSTIPAITNLPGYFVLGNLAAPVLTNLTISPAGVQCVNVARTISVTATPGAASVTGVSLKYQVNGGTIQTVTMSNTTGNVWSGSIPTVAPSNGSVTWSVTATDANGLTKTATGTAYSDEPLNGVSASISTSSTTVCSGAAAQLRAVASKPATAQVGTGTTTAGSGFAAFDAGRSFYGAYWGNGRQQWLIKASELSALGFTAGNITSLAINVVAVGTGTSVNLSNFTIKMGNTSAATITTSFLTSTTTTVYGPVNYTPVVGLNTHNFSNAFVWDGTSNVVLDVCHTTQVTGNNSPTNSYSAPGF